MYCSNCGFKLHRAKPNYCPQCGAEIVAPVRGKPSHGHGHGQTQPPSVGRRIAVTLYVGAYLVLAAVSFEVGQTIYKSFFTPDPQVSYITCRSGAKVSYKLLGIRNPTTDPSHDSLLIDAACRNLGGNTYLNVMRTGPKTSAWEYGLGVFAAGVVVIELVKGTIVYLVKGHFPGLGTLGRR